MEAKELKKILKEHLSIEIYTDYDGCDSERINVCIKFDGEDICHSSEYIH